MEEQTRDLPKAGTLYSGLELFRRVAELEKLVYAWSSILFARLLFFFFMGQAAFYKTIAGKIAGPAGKDKRVLRFQVSCGESKI